MEVPAERRGEVRRVGMRFKRSSVTPEEDAAYMDAVGRDDMETAQRMVHAAAEQHGYKVAVFHGTPSGGFSVFKTLPAYVTENKEYADKYQSPTASSIRFGKQSTQPETKSLFLDPRRMFDTRRKAVRDRFLDEYVRGGEEWAPVSGTNLALSKRGLPDWTEAESIADYIRAKHLPYDSIVVDEGGYFDLAGNVQDRGISYAVLKGSKLKSADPVTYDDAGNVIPLSQRFNPKNPDIRFKRNAAFEHSLDALQSIADGADYGVLHNAKYGEIRYPKGRMGDGGMGFMHIVEHRMNGGATLEEAVDTAIRVGQAAEIGKETANILNTRHFEYDGTRAIVAIQNNNMVVTGYEIDADENAAAIRRAAERNPHPHVGSDEVIGVLRNRIANLRAEVKGGMRFKSAPRAPVDDPEVLFGARESRKAHGLDDLTAEESGLAYTDKELYAAGQRIAKDVPHMMNVVNDALTSDRALPLEDTFALTVVHNLHSRTRNFTAESKSRLMNCEYCEYWICGEK